jgi:hypothetical protein
MNLSHRTTCFFACLFTLCLGALTLTTRGQTPGGQQSATVQVTTVKRSAIQVGKSSFALVKGTKLEVLGREGKMLLVKYRTSQGKIPYADTDYVLSAEEQAEEEEAAAAEPPAPPPPAKKVATPATKPTAALPAVAKHLPDDGQDKSRAGSSQQRETAGQTPGGQPIRQAHGPEPVEGQPTTVPTTPPALSLDQKPATNYGKAVQKAKQVEQAHKDKLVNPADEILDEKPKK